jgi:transcriptional regulator with XRE-family HTH domain
MLAEEWRAQRVAIGLTQQDTAIAASTSRSRYSRIEAASVRLSILEASRISSVLGLDLVLRVYPGPDPIRDAAQQERLTRLIRHVAPPLRYGSEVALPPTPHYRELRAWDGMIYGHGRRTAVEVEMRIRDGQAVERRLSLKRRDDPPDAFLLVVADTEWNRRLLASGGLFRDLRRLRRSRVLRTLGRGEHPDTGIILL